MGTVYEAWHTLLKKTVALKVLSPDRMSDERAVARFRREMEAVGQLNHPSIVRASDVDESDGNHFLVMELVAGGDLHRHVKRLGRFRIADACEAIRHAAEALHHAHAHGLIHRDIKPSNLLLSVDGRVKLADLGLARLCERRAGDVDVAEPGEYVGTADYMAPEQVTGSSAIDLRADLNGWVARCTNC